ncbi:Late competence development protein ComFB [Acididesulfobacillus acetoxydans]|uniref:Late competence development protein ComFB n=1 Tax=Acididesulfobacillus acetoxydans TaxID=1561005 RepID=A0A8S0W2U2_9FIRM|nr:late competence development ComFB family protein [Acididesulfobacillus acetoxydans]CAA7601008.1 Late competence development protein ComFB [Acididesulfobacillus acetoxydans]CEJ06882.1 Late competence development protein ComFB [Acididesulfobacillus acetoxydans]
MFELNNITEMVVREALQDYLRQAKPPCTCDRCQADILALALNRLPPRYAVTLRGEILSTWESRALPSHARIMSELVRAAEQVAAAPSHPLPAENPG